MSFTLPHRLNSVTRQSGVSTPLSKSAPKSQIPSIATVQKPPQTNMEQKMTLHVCLPTQQTVILQVERNGNSAAQIKRIVSQKMGLSDSETIVLSYLGKSLRTHFRDNIAPIATQNSLSTIYVSIALPGGATTNEDARAATQLIDTGSEDPKTTVLKQILNLSGCLSLNDDEIKTLASSLKETQIQKMSKYLSDQIDDDAQISQMV